MLESRLATRLFVRQKRALALTDEGDRFYRAVLSGLETLQSAAMSVAQSSGKDHLTLACTHEISHLFLLPRFDALQEAVGAETRIRVMTFEYDALDNIGHAPVDVLFTYESDAVRSEDRAIVLKEAVVPVCSPDFLRKHEAVLKGDTKHWAGFKLLELTRPNLGWATWETWFDRVGHPGSTLPTTGIGNYVYLLEAAAAGHGLALGWRGMIERYLDAGTLVAIRDHDELFDAPLFAVLTRQGREREAARACLGFFGLPED
jgi:LysR family glycine cleavage system transcriptional activator